MPFTVPDAVSQVLKQWGIVLLPLPRRIQVASELPVCAVVVMSEHPTHTSSDLAAAREDAKKR